MTKKLLFVTGTRADFGKLEPLAIAARDCGFLIEFWVTGMHMMERYGNTHIEVSRVSGVKVEKFVNQTENDTQDIIHAKTVLGFSEFIGKSKPDLVIIHGDRIEALSCALVCATNYVPCAHIEGGEISGTIDEIFRHCNTKLAYCHFVSSQIAADRIVRMGEERDRIYTIGSPELDFHAGPSGISLNQVKERYEIPFEDYGICTFHPVTSEQKTIEFQAQQLFNILDDSSRNFVVILPNNDPGSHKICDVINNLPRNRFRVLPSMRFSYFSELMKNASAIIGNSSAGVREAPFLGIPSLDIGTRQTARGTAKSITKAMAHETDVIEWFLINEWGKNYNRDQGFGQGNAASQFVNVLKSPSFWDKKLQKVFYDT